MREVAALFFAKHGARWVKVAEWQRSLDKYVHPVIGNVAIADVGVPHVLKVVEPIWHRIPETAHRVLGRLEELIDYARIAGLRRDDSNPAKWKGGLDAVLPPPSKIKPTVHHAAMHYRDVPDFMAQAARRAGRCRPRLGISDLDRDTHERNALRGMGRNRRRCVDHSGGRMKMRKAHRVPLSPALSQFCKELRGQHPGSYLSRLPVRTVRLMTTHVEGVAAVGRGQSRRTASVPHSALGPPSAPILRREIAEAALAHTIRSNVERPYKRTTFFDHRRKLMEAWADYCEGRATVTGGDVVALRAARHG